jgi:hypothetical protein
MDDGIPIPGTGLRIGLDPILGLLPGIGDAAGAIVSGAIVLEAMRQRISPWALLRMLGNIALDALVGAVPLLGDLFDAGFKANARNLALLERHLAAPAAARRGDRALVLAIGGVALALVAGVVAGGVYLGALLLRASGW